MVSGSRNRSILHADGQILRQSKLHRVGQVLDEVVDGITNLVAFAGKQGIRPFAICVVGVANGIENLLMVDGQFRRAESAPCQRCLHVCCITAYAECCSAICQHLFLMGR